MRTSPKLLVAMLLLTVSAQANPLTSIPRLFGRTVKNMITFRDKSAAIQQWSIVGAALADAITTQQGLARGAHEENPLFGPYPSRLRFWSTGTAIVLSETSVVQVSHERLDRQNKFMTWPIPMGIATAHTALAISNNQRCRPFCTPQR